MNHAEKVKAVDKAFYHVGYACRKCEHFGLNGRFKVPGCNKLEINYPPYDYREECESYKGE